MRKLIPLLILGLLALIGAACGSDDESTSAATRAPGTSGGPTAAPTDLPDPGPVTLHLGYFANVTHAEPLVGLNNGIFAQELGANVTIDQKTFNAGPDVITALFAGEIDASFIGPNPAVNGYVKSDGKDVRIVSGAASGGALLIVQPGITKVADLANKKIASPQLGNTQDVALRAFLKANGLGAQENGGNVQVIPTANADSLTAFQNRQIDGAWVPEPWATRLILEGGGHVLVDEKSLWPDNKFATTVLIVRTDFLKEHPEVVERLIRANVKTVQWINGHSEEAKKLVNDAIKTITSKGLKDEVINGAWANLEFTYDPVTASVRTSAQNAYDLGLLRDKPALKDLFDLSILDRVLAKEGLAAVSE
ncbi:MAG TPA: ABC transporter substrate-binding protein [Dehalococcoidia bacterium]|nr:ABC transporter substrate-binding protein [Dehalococcoidia bacterium]